MTTRTWRRPSSWPRPWMGPLLWAAALAFLAWNVMSIDVDPARIARGLGRLGTVAATAFPPDFGTRPGLIVSGLVERFPFEQRDLPGEADQRLPRRGRHARLRPAHQNLADGLLQRLDPLADRRGCDVQRTRRGLEAARFHHGLERCELHLIHV